MRAKAIHRFGNWEVTGRLSESRFCRGMELEARVQWIEEPQVGVEVEIKKFALRG